MAAQKTIPIIRDPMKHPTGCPFYEWMGDDLLNSPNGEGKCIVRGFDEYGGSFDYHACDSGNHPTCQYFLAAQEKLTKAPPVR